MKPYLLIRNTGLAPIESFTILGLSTARGEQDKIGQFGSGSKHGILALMRAGIYPRIFIGGDELIFTTHTAKMGEKDYQEVRYTFRGETHKTGMCLDFGALDWDSPTMALREFICNALDQGETIHHCASEADEIIPVPDETRVFIPAEDTRVSEYWSNLRAFFLHFEGLENTPIFPARSTNAQFFRRGVFVTERSGYKSPALFAYNFHGDRIDESRNMDGAAMAVVASRLLRKSQPHVEMIIQSFGGESKWEHDIGGAMWDFTSEGMAGRQVIAAAWKKLHDELPYCDNGATSIALVKKGIRFVPVPMSWGSALRVAGIQNGEDLISQIEKDAAEEHEATESAMETFSRCWRWIELARLTQGKPFPKVKCFSLPMKEGRERCGFFQKSTGTVFLNLDHDTNEQTAIEELAHYITEADDETRDFQDFAFKLATRLAKLRTAPQP